MVAAGSRSGEFVLKDEANQPNRDAAPRGFAATEKSIHLALPVRLTHMRNGQRGALEMACTYEIHSRGARLRSAHDVKVGDLITVERGRTKSVCRVVWAGDPDSALRGQFTVECVEGSKIPWEEELSRMEEQYLPVDPFQPKRKHGRNVIRVGQQNRRRRPRYFVDGNANLTQIAGRPGAEGRLEEISEYGCQVRADEVLVAGTGLRLVLNLCDVSVALRGYVRYAAQDCAMGVEFEEIRQGDRPLLDYVLDRLKKPRVEDFADLEVITEIAGAVAG